MSQADRERWDARYRQGAYAGRLQPSGFLQRWLPRLTLPAKVAALELACGSGRNSLYLSRFLGSGATVTGVDVSAVGLEQAAERARTAALPIRWLQADLEQGWAKAGPPVAGRFDLLLLVRYANTALLAEAAELLNPGGWLLAEVHQPSEIPVGGPSTARFRLAPTVVAEAVTGLVLRSFEQGWYRDPDGRLMALVRLVGRAPPSAAAALKRGAEGG